MSRFRSTRARLCQAACAALVAASGGAAHAQIATLDKGHNLIVNNGLQIWGVASDLINYNINYAQLQGANMNGVVWGFPPNGYDKNTNNGSETNLLSAGQKWGKWTPWQYNTNPGNGDIVTPQNALNALENSHKNDLIALQVGDEVNQSDIEGGTQTRDWLLAAGNGTATTADDVFPNTLLYVNSFYISNHGGYANFLVNGNPDAISWDSYPFANPHGHYIQPVNWLALGQQFRRHGLGNYIGASNAAPRPYGMYLQTCNDSFMVDPGEVEIRWQQFAAWTMGYKFVDAYIYSGGNNNFGNNTSGPVYLNFKETARQSRNLGPALTRLISYGYGTSIIVGKNAAGATNPVPGDWLQFAASNAPPNQQYLTGVSAINLGSKNGGHPGDVYVGFFNPLHLSFGDPAGTTYFMVMNGLGGDLILPNGQSDNTATVAETIQQITLSFNMGASGITSLQRLRRSDGLVEVLPLTHLTGSQYQYIFNLEGGTGDLFKYNDGSPFVGVEAAIANLYWDNDATAAGNNATTGAGLGGGGTWDSSSSKWHNGSSNSVWGPGSGAVFFGTAGTVTLGSPQSANSLTFKTDGYTLTGSTLTMTGPTITVDAGVTASIGSTIAGSLGLVKNGPGTLNLTIANTFTGGTTINEGVLGIISGSTGQNPASPAINIAINNGATLRFNQNNLNLTAQRNVALGTGGGIIDTAFNNSILGVISGTTLTKTGTGTLTISGANTHAATAINGGTLLVSSDSNLGAVPASFTTGNLTLNGGTLKFEANVDIANNRGIALGASGGTIDTQGFSNPAGYNASAGGFTGPGDLIKLGSGTFFAAATTGGANTTWKGRLILKEGIWNIVASDGLPYNVAAADGVKADQVTLDGGTWQIGATISVSNGRRGITVAANGGTIDTQGFDLTWAGPMAGVTTSSVLNKNGAGILRFTGANSASTYNGIVNINAGTLRLDAGVTMGDLATINLLNVAGATLNIVGTETIGSLSGGGTTGGNVTLGSSLTTGGNNATTTFGGAISGAGGLTKAGSGTMLITGGKTNTAATSVNGGTLRFDGTGATTWGASVNVSAGTLSLTRTGGVVAVSPGITFAVSSGATLELGGSVAALSDGVDHANVMNNSTTGFNVTAGNQAAGNVDGTGNTTVASGTSLTASRVRQNALTVDGTVNLRPGGAAGASDVTTLAIGVAGKLDMVDGKVITQSSIGSWNGTNYTGLTGAIKTARNGGSWNGPSGVYTSMTAAQGATPLTTLAIAAASDIGRVGTTFGGVSLVADDVMLMYTYAGDADLNGDIDGDDFFAIDVGYNASASGYWRGDFNYDGRVDADDYFIINRNYARNLPPLSSGAIADGVTVVPEPAGLAVAGMIAAMMGRRRRRSHMLGHPRTSR